MYIPTAGSPEFGAKLPISPEGYMFPLRGSTATFTFLGSKPGRSSTGAFAGLYSEGEKLESIEPKFEIRSSGVQWFDLGVVFESSSGEKFSAADIQRLVLGGQGHTRLRNGKMAILDTGAVEELQEVLLDCAPQQHADGYRMKAEQAGFLEASLKNHPGWKLQAPTGWRERAAR